MSFKIQFQQSSDKLAKLVSNPDTETDGRLVSSLYTAAQDFVRNAKKFGIYQNTASNDNPANQFDLDKLKQLIQKVEKFANAKGDIKNDLGLAAQRLVNYIYEMGITANSMPIPPEALETKSRASITLWAPRA